MKCSYDVDRNLDGKFDEKDKDVKINLKGENIDEGIMPDYQLENPDDFFDIAKIGQLIESYYAK